MEKESAKFARKQKKPIFGEANIPRGSWLREGASITVPRYLDYKGGNADFGAVLSVPAKARPTQKQEKPSKKPLHTTKKSVPAR